MTARGAQQWLRSRPKLICGRGCGGAGVGPAPTSVLARIQWRLQRNDQFHTMAESRVTRQIFCHHRVHSFISQSPFNLRNQHAALSSILSMPSALSSSSYSGRSNSSVSYFSTSKASQIASKNNKKDGSSEMDRRTFYSLLKLSDFSSSEFDWRFDRIVRAGDEALLKDQYSQQPIQARNSPNVCDNSHSSLQSSPIETLSTSLIGDDKDESQQREIMCIQDLEAYLLERYEQFEEQWEEKNLDKIPSTHGKDDDQRAQLQIERMEQRATEDAAYMFQLLLENAPSETTATTKTPQSSSSHVQQNPIQLTKHQFNQSLTALATALHTPTILPLSTSMLLVGASVGVISPIMPFLASSLQLTTTHYGLVVSSFALSKMLANVPSAILADRHGRKPYLVHSLVLVGTGVGLYGVCGDWMQLCGCRMTVGLGVAAFTTASTLTVADVSTPLSRASAFSPLMSAFAAGMALGPAIGGMLHDAWGIRDTFFAVGLSYGVTAIWNHVSVRETKMDGEWWEKDALPWHDPSITNPLAAVEKMGQVEDGSSSLTTTISNAIKDTTEQWTSLVANPKVRPVVIMNGFYMLALSGTQFTLLPLILTGSGGTTAGTAAGLALSASAVGQLYMFMSGVQVLGNPAAGRFADRAGKAPAIVMGGALTSFAMASVPMICSFATGDVTSLASEGVNWPLLAGALGVWSLGGTLLATSHVAAISDAVDDSQRSQAIALLRTAGDVGYLCGAISAGLAADMAGDVGLAMQGGSAILMGSTAWFGVKTLALSRLDKRSKER